MQILVISQLEICVLCCVAPGICLEQTILHLRSAGVAVPVGLSRPWGGRFVLKASPLPYGPEHLLTYYVPQAASAPID